MSGRFPRAPKRWLIRAALLACLASSGAHASQPPNEAGEKAPAVSQGPPPGAAVSLQEAIQTAHQNHGRVAIAEETVEAARQRIRQARTGTLPTVSGEIGYRGRGTSNLSGFFGPTPTRTVGTGGPGSPRIRQQVDTETATFDQGLQPRIALNYNIYDGGLTRASVRQARAGLDGNIASLSAVRNDLALTVTTNFFLQLRSERLLVLRREQVRLAQQQLDEVDERIRVGSTAMAERALSLSELRNRQLDLLEAENAVRLDANALRNSMGLPVGPPLKLVELGDTEQPLPPLESLRAIARRERPEVVQAEAQVRVAQQSVSIARIGRKPRLDTTFAFNVSPNAPLTRSDFAVGAAVSLPLWDAGLTHSRELEAKTDVQSATAQLEQTKKDVAADVEEAYLTLVNSRDRLAASELAVEAARINLEATTARFRAGIAGVTVVDLVQAQVQFANASNAAISAQYDIHLAQGQLTRALGR